MNSRTAFSTLMAAMSLCFLPSGCAPIFAIPQLPAELAFVEDNPDQFATTNRPAEIMEGTDIDASLLDGCWGATSETAIDAGDESGDNDAIVDSVTDATGILPVIPVRESIVYSFNADAGTLTWQLVSADGFGLIITAKTWTGPYEISDGNRLVFTPQQAGFSDPASGNIITGDITDSDRFEWLIAVDQSTLNLQALGDLANRDNNVDRDNYVFNKFDCP